MLVGTRSHQYIWNCIWCVITQIQGDDLSIIFYLGLACFPFLAKPNEWILSLDFINTHIYVIVQIMNAIY
jgi:hypothetical protein